MSDKGVCVLARVCVCACACACVRVCVSVCMLYEMRMWLIIDMLLFYLLATQVRNDEKGEMDLLFQYSTNTHRLGIFVAHFRYITYDISPNKLPYIVKNITLSH